MDGTLNALRGARWSSHLPWLLGALFGVLYLWTFTPRSDGIIIGNDVVTYADWLGGRNTAPLRGYGNHIGYHWLCWIVYRVLLELPGSVEGIGLGLRAQQIVSALGGALTIAAIARLSIQHGGWLIALALSCALALTHGVWFSSSVGDSYMPAMGASAWLLCSALKPAIGADRQRAALLFAWLLIAILMRQDAVLILPALLVIVPWRTLVAVAAAAAMAAAGCYALGWAYSGTTKDFTSWMLGHGSEGKWGHVWTARGLEIAWIQLKYVFQAASKVKPGSAWWTLSLLLLATALSWRLPKAAIRGAIACAIHALTCFGFFTWWQAENVEYQIPMLLPLAALFAILLPRQSSSWRSCAQAVLVAAAAIALGVGAWTIRIRPFRGQAISAHSRLALDAAGPDGAVFALDGWQGLALTREQGFVFASKACEPSVRTFDGAAIPRKQALGQELHQELVRITTSGHAAVIIGEQVFPRAQIGLSWARPEAVAKILEGLRNTPVLDEHGEVVAWRVEP